MNLGMKNLMKGKQFMVCITICQLLVVFFFFMRIDWLMILNFSLYPQIAKYGCLSHGMEADITAGGRGRKRPVFLNHVWGQ